MNHIGRVNKKDVENFAPENQQKKRDAPDFMRKQPKSGAFWVLEGMGTVENRCERIEKTGKLGGIRGTDLSRLPPRSVRGRAPLALAHPTTRTARGAAAPRCQDIPPANEKRSGTAEAIPDLFGRGRRTRTLGTRFWSGCGNTTARTGKRQC